MGLRDYIRHVIGSHIRICSVLIAIAVACGLGSLIEYFQHAYTDADILSLFAIWSCVILFVLDIFSVDLVAGLGVSMFIAVSITALVDHFTYYMSALWNSIVRFSSFVMSVQQSTYVKVIGLIAIALIVYMISFLIFRKIAASNN